MDEPRVIVKEFSWRDVCPAFLIFRSLPMSLNITVLVLALAGVVLTPIGWLIMEGVFVGEELAANEEFAEIAELNRSPYKAVFPHWQSGNSMLTVLGNQLRGVELVFKAYGRSFYEAVSLEPGTRRCFYFVAGGIWTLFVWSFFGCAICRVALMRYTRDEPIGIDDAVDYAIDKFLSCFAGVLIPLLGVFALSVPLALLGLLMATNFGAALGGIVWIVVLAVAFLITLILFGLAFAWPLIISAISCEGQDSFDGMSRAFAYIFQRPLHFFCYVLLAVVFSGICWLVVSTIVQGAVNTSFWATSWGSNVGSYRTGDLSGEYQLQAASIDNAIRDDVAAGKTNLKAQAGKKSTDASQSPGDSTPFMLWVGRGMIQFWNGVALTLGAAFLYGMFWTIVPAIYLLLRKDLDDTEMDEIYLVDERRTFELPPLREDGDGVPQVDETPESSADDQQATGSDQTDQPPAE